jgi:hypothetical protein
MSVFDDRERSFETKFARDEEMAFRITARRNRLVGAWAAGLMGLTAEESDAYCKAVVQADFEEAGDEDVIRKRPASTWMKPAFGARCTNIRSKRAAS